ncbi:exported hypothetical protein [Candidatus Zixiibacteriota bacterium]|nr:exported hypothetical protein [candidate division Zixibacteria bacterium]
MKASIIISILAVAIIFNPGRPASGQSLSLDVYPSDEELFDAYMQGEFDYTTYLNLQEIFETGIDSSDLYLLDEIPNLSYFSDSRLRGYRGLEREQEEPFLTSDTSKGAAISGNLKIKRYQDLDEEALGRNHYLINGRITPRFLFDARVNEDNQRNREWKQRSLTYKSWEGLIRRMALGNFNARCGLGLAIGYRGRVLNKNFPTFDKSFFFPDYGSFNGAYLESRRKNDAVKLLLHYDRDDTTRVRTAAASMMRQYRKFRLEGIVLQTNVDNIHTHEKFNFHQFDFYGQFRSEIVTSAVEVALQQKTRRLIGAIVAETEYRSQSTTLQGSFWKYDDDYINLTGGGRSGRYYRTVSIDTLDFDFRDRRSDQEGALLRGLTSIAENMKYHFSFSAFGPNRFQRFLAFQNGFDFALSDRSTARLEYRYREQNEFDGTISDHQFRAELKRTIGEISLRSYLGYLFDQNRNKYLACFLRIRTAAVGPGKLDLWLNFSKINMRTGRLDYFYGYLQEIITAIKNLEVTAKYLYRYGRAYSESGKSGFYLEGRLIW